LAIGVAGMLTVAGSVAAAERHDMRGMVLLVDPAHKSFLVSHESAPGVMDAMTMSFDVREPKELEGVAPGMTVEFTLVLDRGSAYAESIRIRPYESVEQDPLTARRLKLLRETAGVRGSSVSVGQRTPDFTLIDQTRRPVSLSELRGRVVAINFIYTSCVLPQFCFRLANSFAAVARRFQNQMGRDLVLLTVTFDPVRDQPERLAEYASQWKVDADVWRFLTGAVEDVKRVCGLFGVDFFPDEGLINHTSHTAIIDRRGTLFANIDGNQFTTTQLGDLIETALKR
jgi:protein SCO1/2